MSNKRSALRPYGVLDARAIARTPKRGMELVNLKELGIIPGIAGGARGYSAQGDIVTKTIDGMDINALWDVYQETLGVYNEPRTRLVNFLTYGTTLASEPYGVAGDLADFQEATEYGEPVGYRPNVSQKFLGYTFKWYDLAARFTWMFLANAPASQVDSIQDMAMEADNRLVFTQVMKTLFNNTRRVNEQGTTVYPLYSGVTGADGDDPPDVGAKTFADGHNHYNTAPALTAAAVETLYNNIAEHGYTTAQGYSAVLMVNKVEGDKIRQWRSAVNGGVSPGTGGGLYDFIPAQGTPSFLLPQTLRIAEGQTAPPNTLNGMTVIGTYGDFTVVQEDYVPAGYLIGFVTGGPESIRNLIAFREHANASLRGLRLVKGRTPDYPLIDSFYNRGFGTGIKYRGAGAILQITGGSYTVPSQYTW
jgi:hypothetical protein